MRRLLALAVTLGVLADAGVATAQEVRTQAVRFAPGKSSATLRGSITGSQSVLYTIGAQAGQTLKVNLKPPTGRAQFNLYAPGKGPGDEALAIGDLLPDANRYSGVLPASGTYTVSVFMNRASARRNARASYTLEIAIPASAAAPAGAPVDLAAECRRYAAVDFATRPDRIRTAGTRPGPEGPMVDATANLGAQGVKPFACRFDQAGRYLGLFSKVDEGAL